MAMGLKTQTMRFQTIRKTQVEEVVEEETEEVTPPQTEAFQKIVEEVARTIQETVSNTPEETISENEIQISPNAVFAYTRDEWNTFTFTVLTNASDQAVSIWDFGDGVSSSKPTVQHVYTSSGAFPVILTMTDENGIISTEQTTVFVPFSTWKNRLVLASVILFVASALDRDRFICSPWKEARVIMLTFFRRESKTIIGAATVVGILSFASRVVGFVRDRVLAGEFGAGDTLDVYYAAFKIPDLLFQLDCRRSFVCQLHSAFLKHYQKSARQTQRLEVYE